MRSRDAENLIAEVLTKGSKGVYEEDQISKGALLGLLRATPIYARKIREKRDITQQRRFFFYRRIMMIPTSPIVALIRLLKP
jgi:hypothetical protein